MTDSVDRRKTKDVLWMTFQCAIFWKESLVDAHDPFDPEVRGFVKDIKAIKRLQEKLFPNTQDALDGMLQRAVSVSVFDILELMEGEGPKPCGRPGCFSHVTHPCEGCGRIAGKVSSETGGDHEQG